MTHIQKSGKLIIFDKDGCLVKSVEGKNGKSHAPNTLETQEYFDDVEQACAELRAAGNVLAVASNQGGVAFGIFGADEATALVKAAADYIGAASYRVCLYHPKGRVHPYNFEHPNRKPAPGMLKELMQELGYTPEQTLMVGDWDTDKQAAEAAGCGFVWAHEFFGRVDPFADRLHNAMKFGL
jgi:D-glycero-D-manno-heptose 1,7-bisphosphate phosphatase